MGNEQIHYSPLIIHSVLNDRIGFAIAALIAWKLTVIKVINNAPIAAITNTGQRISIL